MSNIFVDYNHNRHCIIGIGFQLGFLNDDVGIQIAIGLSNTICEAQLPKLEGLIQRFYVMHRAVLTKAKTNIKNVPLYLILDLKATYFVLLNVCTLGRCLSPSSRPQPCMLAVKVVIAFVYFSPQANIIKFMLPTYVQYFKVHYRLQYYIFLNQIYRSH